MALHHAEAKGVRVSAMPRMAHGVCYEVEYRACWTWDGVEHGVVAPTAAGLLLRVKRAIAKENDG